MRRRPRIYRHHCWGSAPSGGTRRGPTSPQPQQWSCTPSLEAVIRGLKNKNYGDTSDEGPPSGTCPTTAGKRGRAGLSPEVSWRGSAQMRGVLVRHGAGRARRRGKRGGKAFQSGETRFFVDGRPTQPRPREERTKCRKSVGTVFVRLHHRVIGLVVISRFMIRASGARGPEFDSRITPKSRFCSVFPWPLGQGIYQHGEDRF